MHTRQLRVQTAGNYLYESQKADDLPVVHFWYQNLTAAAQPCYVWRQTPYPDSTTGAINETNLNLFFGISCPAYHLPKESGMEIKSVL